MKAEKYENTETKAKTNLARLDFFEQSVALNKLNERLY